MTSKPAGRIQLRVREILREGAEFLEGGKRHHTVEAWERRVFPAYGAYESSLIGGRQRLIAVREFAKIRAELLVYPEDEIEPAEGRVEGVLPAPAPAGLELAPEELDIYALRARAVVKFVHALEVRA